MKKLFLGFLSLMMIFSLLGCSKETNKTGETNESAVVEGNSKEEKRIILATTTSTEDSGLLSYLLPIFEKETNIKVDVVAKGTGAAMEVAKNGDADVLLVHAKEKEDEFIKEDYGTERIPFMYNDFIIVGPKTDDANLKTQCPNDPEKAFQLIYDEDFKFISRGDDSGTHSKENSIWKSIGITPERDSYVSAGKGMGDVLLMASELQGYTLTDRATYLSMKDKLDLEIVVEKNDLLYNQYAFVRLNYDKLKIEEKEASDEFIDWMISKDTLSLIDNFGKEEYGQALFTSNYEK